MPAHLLPDEGYLIACGDRRLIALAEQVFSPELKIPSVKFALVTAYFSFFLLCFCGQLFDWLKLPFISSVMKFILIVWFGMMASVVAPILFLFNSKQGESLLVQLSLVVLAVPVLFVAIKYLWKYVLQPSSIKLAPDGIHPRWALSFRQDSSLIHWIRIDSIYFEGSDQANIDAWNLVISGNGRKLLAIRLGSITKVEDRYKILEAVQSHCPEVKVDPRIIQAWTPSHNSSYTELWLQSLAAPPKRARLAQLDPSMCLQDGQYEIERLLATGGQSIVYLAKRKSDDALLVLKEMIIPVYGDEDTRRRELEDFEKEARFLKNLDHDHIVKLQEFFVEDHRGYLVLEYIDGQSLASLVEEKGALPEADVLKLAKEMCEILSFLHGMSPPVVHRDFTPDNLMLTKEGMLKLIDFNVAHEMKFTTTATVVGKHAYLPPEQFRGKPCPASDIYALGGTLFFLLTGQTPEPISSNSPILTNSEVSAELDRIVARATEPEVKSRYQSVAELQAELETLMKPALANVANEE